MKFKLNKIFGKSNHEPTTAAHNVNNIEDIIKSVDGDAFAISEHDVLFAKTSELGGYFYVIAIIIGAFKIKTTKGATLNIKGTNFDLLLNSDMDEFESEHTHISKRYVSRIDFQIEKEDVSKFDKTRIKTLKLSTKKKAVVFTTVS